jgi:hypothetical protein
MMPIHFAAPSASWWKKINLPAEKSKMRSLAKVNNAALVTSLSVTTTTALLECTEVSYAR